MFNDIINFTLLSKNLKKDFTNFKIIKIAILCDSASQFVTKAIKGIGYEHEINYEIFEADYNQIYRQAYDLSSELYNFKPDFVIILQSTEKLISKFYITSNNKVDFANLQLNYIKGICDQILNNHKCNIIINSFPEFNDSVFGNFSTKVNSSFVYQIKKLNFELMNLTQSNTNIYLIHLESIFNYLGFKNCYDSKMYIGADMVYSLDLLPLLAKYTNDIILSINGNFKKCLILDLDNTMWGGIIGDDGLNGIQVGDFGIGKAYTDLQLWIKELKNRGIILAVCSKNNEDIAKEPFFNHPEMKLKLEDISVFVANWENKVDNIKHIQNILNINFDSIVFLDDNPFEREMVKSAITGITVPNLPEDPGEYLNYLRSLNLFETASFTNEDVNRTLLYQEEAKRSTLQKSFTNENDFLQSLNMEAHSRPFDNYTIPRIAQLSQRSNQFNLRTIRYTEEQVKLISESNNYFTLSLSLKDKFGDYGLVSYVILKRLNSTSLFIENWVMSCRVLKRGIENYILDLIIEIAKEMNFNYIIGEYLPTKKNELVKDHYINLNFTNKGDNQFELNISKYKQEIKPFIKNIK